MAYLEGVVGCQLQSVQTKDLAQDIRIPTSSVIDHDSLTLQVLYACYRRSLRYCMVVAGSMTKRECQGASRQERKSLRS